MGDLTFVPFLIKLKAAKLGCFQIGMSEVVVKMLLLISNLSSYATSYVC